MLSLSILLGYLASSVIASPNQATRTLKGREPHPAVLQLPTPGTEIQAPSYISNHPVGYFEFPLIMVDGELIGSYARVAFQNSTGTYVIGRQIEVYNSYTFEDIVKSNLAIVAPGDYTLLVQEHDTFPGQDEWLTVVTTNVTLYSMVCGSDPTCCWTCPA